MVAESWFTPEDWYDTNVSGLAKLVNNLRRVKKFPIIKFLHFSTPEVYGSTRNLIKENWNFNPTTPYAISRAASDLHLRAMFDSFGFPVIFTRTANIYGSHQRLYRIIPKLITKVIKGEEFQLHGAGNSLRSFIHSADVASALSLILEKGDIGETYHISGQEFISILDLTKKILRS
jgi:dTDP-glucose 4,6-dehydratase